MEELIFKQALTEIVQTDPRYEIGAYQFVREALDFCVRRLKKPKDAPPAERHISGQQLLDGIRRYALQEYGPLALTVLRSWGVRRCEDFGEIVFNMVEKRILGKTDEDKREDFGGGYDFEEVFAKPFRPASRAGGGARPDAKSRLPKERRTGRQPQQS